MKNTAQSEPVSCAPAPTVRFHTSIWRALLCGALTGVFGVAASQAGDIRLGALLWLAGLLPFLAGIRAWPYVAGAKPYLEVLADGLKVKGGKLIPWRDVLAYRAERMALGGHQLTLSIQQADVFERPLDIRIPTNRLTWNAFHRIRKLLEARMTVRPADEPIQVQRYLEGGWPAQVLAAEPEASSYYVSREALTLGLHGVGVFRFASGFSALMTLVLLSLEGWLALTGALVFFAAAVGAGFAAAVAGRTTSRLLQADGKGPVPLLAMAKQGFAVYDGEFIPWADVRAVSVEKFSAGDVHGISVELRENGGRGDAYDAFIESCHVPALHDTILEDMRSYAPSGVVWRV